MASTSLENRWSRNSGFLQSTWLNMGFSDIVFLGLGMSGFVINIFKKMFLIFVKILWPEKFSISFYFSMNHKSLWLINPIVLCLL